MARPPDPLKPDSSPDPAAVSASLRTLAAAAESDARADLFTGLQDVVDACVEIFHVTGCGVMIADDSSVIHYACASDGQARLLEKAESATGEGPCTQAFVDDTVVTSTDLRAETRWPQFRSALAGEPEVRAVVGLPVRLGGVPVGTLDVFRDRPHAWSDAEREALVRYAAVVGTTLRAALAAHTAGEQAAHLQYALDYRVVIERGVGYLMARDAVDSVTAFNLLRSTSRNSRTKIGRVAQYLLDTGRLPPGHG